MSDQVLRPTLAEKEASEWYMRLSSTVIENQDLARFEVWRKTPENREAYDRVSASASRLAGLRGEPGLEDLAEAALDRAAGPRRSRRAIGAGAGAALVVLVGLGAWGLWGQGSRYASEVGQRRVVALADGSTVLLNTDSQVIVKMTRGERRVTLVRGQALFQVAKDAQRPFIVAAGDAEITALGTRFDVYRRDGDVQIVLAEGKVAVRDETVRNRSWTLAAGQKIVVGARAGAGSGSGARLGAALARPVPADVGAATGWTSGQLVFHDTPLAEAVAEVNRYSDSKIVLGRDAPRERRISGAFPTGDVDGFVVAAGDLLDLEVRRGPGSRTVELQGRPLGPP
jgi:transmembrane sensor